MTEKQVYEITNDIFDYSCAICKSNVVAMHHIRYGAEGRHTYLGNVIPLCPRHHNLVHSNKKKYQPMLIEMCNKKLKENGFKEVNL